MTSKVHGMQDLFCMLRASASTLMTPGTSASLWEDILDVYERARAGGAAYKTDTNTEIFRDPHYGVDFVLRVATALRDKPKPPKDRHAALLRGRKKSLCLPEEFCCFKHVWWEHLHHNLYLFEQ